VPTLCPPPHPPPHPPTHTHTHPSYRQLARVLDAAVTSSGGDPGEWGRREADEAPAALRFSPRPSPRSGSGPGLGLPLPRTSLPPDDAPPTVSLTLLRAAVVSALACRIAPLGHAEPWDAEGCVCALGRWSELCFFPCRACDVIARPCSLQLCGLPCVQPPRQPTCGLSVVSPCRHAPRVCPELPPPSCFSDC
jgi:hypothetical protein